MADDEDKLELEDEREDGESEQGQPIPSDDREGKIGAEEAQDLDEGDERDEEEVEAPRGRAQSRIRALSSTAREASERAAAAERRAQDLEARLSRLEQPAAPREREPTAEEMALWTNDQVVDYKLNRATKGLDERVNQLQYQAWEAGDRAGWSGYCANDTRAAKMAPAVEQRLQELRGRGILNWTRGDVYMRLLAERMIQQGSKAAATQRQQGKQRIARQTTTAGNLRSDQSSERRRELSEKEARDRRLKDHGFIV